MRSTQTGCWVFPGGKMRPACAGDATSSVAARQRRDRCGDRLECQVEAATVLGEASNTAREDASAPLRRLLKNPRVPRCCQFSEDRKEPSAGRSRSATDKLGDTARAENWRNPEGVSPLGHLSASLLSYSPFRGCSFVPPPMSAPKNSRVTCVGFSTVS